jgi:AAA15 family ATPase/GTPase
MLIEFRIRNFKCFRDEQVFSLVASSDKSHPDNAVEVPGQRGLRVLKSAVVYGANAAGKTTLLDALYFFSHFVRTSASRELDRRIDVQPFLLDSDSAGEPSSLEATFTDDDGVRYQYGYSLDRTRVHEEWLTSYPKGRPRRLFRRTVESDGESHFQFSSYFTGEKDKLSRWTRPNALFLSVGAGFNQEQLLHVYRWFSEKMYGVQANRLTDSFPILMAKDQQRGPFLQVRELLKSADLGIIDFEVKQRELTPEALSEDLPEETRDTVKALVDGLPGGARKRVDIWILHQARGKKVAFDLGDESNGTRQLFALSSPILSALAEGDLLFIDELDTSLHPHLAQALVRLFHDPRLNPKNAQLVFNTHDTTLLSASIFRRDQVWLVEKDKDGAACIYSLLDFSPRKDEALEKGYLQGRYGAIPFLSEPLEGILSDA